MNSGDSLTYSSATENLLRDFGIEEDNSEPSKEQFLENMDGLNLKAIGSFLYSFLIEPGKKASAIENETVPKAEYYENNYLIREPPTFNLHNDYLTNVESGVEGFLLDNNYIDGRTLAKLKLNSLDCFAILPYVRTIALHDIAAKRKFQKVLFILLSRNLSHSNIFAKLSENFIQHTHLQSIQDTTVSTLGIYKPPMSQQYPMYQQPVFRPAPPDHHPYLLSPANSAFVSFHKTEDTSKE